MNKPVPYTTKNVTTWLTSETRNLFDALCHERGKSKSIVLRELIEKELKNNPPTSKKVL